MTDPVAEQLVSWGRVARIETRGRQTGAIRTAAIGFVAEADGSFLIAAGSPQTDWARNLEAEPRCRLTIGQETFDCSAERLAGAEHAGTVRSLILRYGTPSEGLGRGPSFRLRPSPHEGR